MVPKISVSEWEVMNVVWAHEPLTAVELYQLLPKGHGWKQKTVNTFLSRLVDKGALSAIKNDRAFVYSSRIPRGDCVENEGETFLQRVFKGATGSLVLHFCERADLTPEEIKELEQILRAKKAKR
jgi:BlaI family penicillinase repressor